MAKDLTALEAAASVLADQDAKDLTSYLERGRQYGKHSDDSLSHLYKAEHAKWCATLPNNIAREFADLNAEYSLRGSKYINDAEDDALFAAAADKMLEANPGTDQDTSGARVFAAYEKISSAQKKH